ncbi:hypothetical protein [Pseudonocardia sp. TRM90224]|uniref:hypothetical protein n=1 Tax=Pseudonocardia sp. TRM90224 TaxID=2812678 RepID=UPI001E3E9996|nr:hypothetical protein [Pseudonocardia sp. TRM90224]
MVDSWTSAAERRIVARLPEGAAAALASELSPSDLQTLLLATVRERAAQVDPRRVLRRWQDDRFVRPAPSDARAVARVENRLWELLPPSFDGLELSPVAPLGTCSAVAPGSQDRIVSTVRGTEVLSDPTNALAVEVAVRRQAGGQRVDLAASHRVLRAQPFDRPGLLAHFRLFALVSGARDTGSGRTEAELLTAHLGYWAAVLRELLPGRETRLTTTVFDAPVLRERLADTVTPAVPVPLVDDADRTKGAGYYTGMAIGIEAADGEGGWHELGDGGFTTWTQQMLGNAKERCLTSCISVERLAALA